MAPRPRDAWRIGVLGFLIPLPAELNAQLESPIQSSVEEASASETAEELGERPGYSSYDQLTTELQRMYMENADACELTSMGTSRQGRNLWVMRIARGSNPEARPALALVAGLDGAFPASSEVALRVARKLVESSDELLERCTFYVLPRVNPDGMESFFKTPLQEHAWNVRPWDDDRDGQTDEDGPDDVNCDGILSLMRVRDPEGTLAPDPAEPRLLKEADRAKAEKPIYKLYPEGVDDDEDGEYDEDGQGGVDVDLNFMHGYREHALSAGPHPISEPESKALIEFFLQHPRITQVVVHGRHDNLINTPEGGRMDAPGQASNLIHKEDVPIYKFIGERYKKITGQEEAPKEECDGAFFAWAYAQHGIPSFACRVWTRPIASKTEPGKGESSEAPLFGVPLNDDGSPSDSAQSAAPSKTEPPARADVGDEKKSKKDENKRKDENKPADREAADWLTYSDQERGGEGFLAWTPFEHPQLGPVEIGGFKPFFRTTPPADQLEDLAAKQTEFILDLAERFPQPRLEEPKVEALSSNVYEITSALVNDGYFPTGLAMAEQNGKVGPIVVTLDVPLERFIGGDRVRRIESVPGGGGYRELRWVIVGTPGERIPLRWDSSRHGGAEREIVLPPPTPDAE